MTVQAFFPTVQNIIDRALTDIGAIDPEGNITPSTAQRTDAMQVLNFMVTSWIADGMQVWCQKEISGLALVANQELYTIGVSTATPHWSLGPNTSRPLEVTQAWLSDVSVTPNIDTPLRLISREEYNLLSQKESSGTPNCMFYDPAYDKTTSNIGATNVGVCKIWPSPQAADVTRYRVSMLYTRPINDFSATSDTLDFPQEWYNAVRWGLAAELATGYEVPVMKFDRIRALAKESKALALSFDRERQSVTMSPATSTGQ